MCWLWGRVAAVSGSEQPKREKGTTTDRVGFTDS